MKLTQSKTIRSPYHHERCVRYVDSDFNDGRAHEQVDIACSEPAHDIRLLIRAHLPVEKLTPHTTERRGDSGELRYRRSGFDLVRILDQRAYHEYLSALRHRLLDARVDLVVRGVRYRHCRRGRPSGGHLVDHGHLEITVQRHRECPRNRCCGHEQEVGDSLALVLVAHHDALFHTKTMLLVHDGDPEGLEFDVLLDQRLSTECNVDGAICQPLETLGA